MDSFEDPTQPRNVSPQRQRVDMSEFPTAPDFVGYAAAASCAASAHRHLAPGDQELAAALKDAGRAVAAASRMNVASQQIPPERRILSAAEERVQQLEEMLAKERMQAEQLRKQLRDRELRELAKERRRIAAVGSRTRSASQHAPEHRASPSPQVVGPQQRHPSPQVHRRPSPQRPVQHRTPGTATPQRCPSPVGSEGRRPTPLRQSWLGDPGTGTLKTDLHGVTHLLRGRQGARAEKWTSAWAHGLRGSPEWEDAEESARLESGRAPWRGVSWHERRATRSRQSPQRQRTRSATPQRGERRQQQQQQQ
eukprot:Hpha_TRINITY_DN15282_c2_g1::TRINITY_DN15282_c2_g1_i1::g.66661::m.66661